MRAWLPAISIGTALAAVAVLVVLAAAPEAARSSAQRVEALATELRCPDCQGLSVADSPTRSAQEIRRQVDELIAGGASDAEVRAHFVARYGQWILLAPSSPIPWVVPFAVVLAAVVVLGAWLVGRRPDGAAIAPALSDEERRRVRDEAEALDA